MRWSESKINRHTYTEVTTLKGTEKEKYGADMCQLPKTVFPKCSRTL